MQYSCPQGHTFESENLIRAFCPTCGTNTRKNSPPPSSPSTNTLPEGTRVVTVRRKTNSTKQSSSSPKTTKPPRATSKATSTKSPRSSTRTTSSSSHKLSPNSSHTSDQIVPIRKVRVPANKPGPTIRGRAKTAIDRKAKAAQSQASMSQKVMKLSGIGSFFKKP